MSFLPVWEQATTSFHAILIHHSPLKLFHKHQCFGKINKQMNNTAMTQMQIAYRTLRSINTILFTPTVLRTQTPKPGGHKEVYFTPTFFQVAKCKQA
jgi:hypothetical protein